MSDHAETAPWVWVLTGVTAPAVLVAAWWLASTSGTRGIDVAVATIGLALGSAIVIPTRTGAIRTAAHGVGAVLPLVAIEGVRIFDWRGSLAASVGGIGLVWLTTSVRGKNQRKLVPVLLRALVTFCAYLAVSTLAGGYPPFDSIEGWGRTLLFLAAAAVAFLVETLATSLIVWGRERGTLRYRLALAWLDFDSFVAITGTGALFGLSYGYVEWWAALVMSILPYSFTHTSLVRYRGTKRTYEQTLRALAQIPEVAGHSRPGHALMAAKLGRQLGLDLGLLPGRLQTVEHAALMHDVGRIALNEPGIVQKGYTESDIARWSYEVLSESRHLGAVAADVRRQYDPYRVPGGAPDSQLSIGSRIVKVVAAYLSLTEGGQTPVDALDQIQRGTSDDFDPAIVAALRKRLDRTGALRHPINAR